MNRPITREEQFSLNRVCRKHEMAVPKPKDLRELVRFVVYECNDLQTDICGQANVVRKEINPRVIKGVGLEKEEYTRGLKAAKLKLADRSGKIKTGRVKNTESYKKFLGISRKLEEVEEA